MCIQKIDGFIEAKEKRGPYDNGALVEITDKAALVV